MGKQAAGRRFFILLSVVLWALTAWLLLGADQSDGSRILALACGFVALVASAHALLYAKYGERKSRNADWFRQHGTPVQATIVKIGKRGRRTAWRIKAQGRDRQGNVFVYKSEILRANPGRRYQTGDAITVYLDPADANRYWMDTGIGSEYL